MILCSLSILETESAPDTFLRTEGLQPLIYPVTAKSAFLRPAVPGTKSDRVVRTGNATVLAAGAFLPVKKDNSIRPLVDSPFCRTGLQTGRILTVHAGGDLPGEAEQRVLTHRHIRRCAVIVEQPHPRAHCDLVFSLAGDHARAATDTSFRIKYQTIPLGHFFSYAF
jgi:hypothetical protein